jgi:hypothetical protein
MRFLAQKIDGQVTLDFVFALQESQRYFKWRGDPFTIKFVNNIVPSDLNNKYIPIGTVEFVKSYVEKYCPNKTACLVPLNVPSCLRKWAGRKIHDIINSEIANTSDFMPGDEVYRKSLTTIKDPTNGYLFYNNLDDLVGYQVSSIIHPEILSEWRVFVYKNQPQQVCFYAGDSLVFPDPKIITAMVDDYSESPISYTLDVYVNKTGTYLLECHRFFSCGLYGFSDYRILPYMFSQEWYEMMQL